MWQVFSMTRSASSTRPSRKAFGRQDIGHARSVIGVHLTAIGFDEKFLALGLYRLGIDRRGLQSGRALVRSDFKLNSPSATEWTFRSITDFTVSGKNARAIFGRLIDFRHASDFVDPRLGERAHPLFGFDRHGLAIAFGDRKSGAPKRTSNRPARFSATARCAARGRRRRTRPERGGSPHRAACPCAWV